MLSEVSINGSTSKWMVYNGKSQSKMVDVGVPSILGNLHIYILVGGLEHEFYFSIYWE
jgi:hypothetical protein